MSSRSDGRGVLGEGAEEYAAPAPRAARVGLDSEALENFAEVLTILTEWDEAERRETEDDDANKVPDNA